jgi:hypothetical protein
MEIQSVVMELVVMQMEIGVRVAGERVVLLLVHKRKLGTVTVVLLLNANAVWTSDFYAVNQTIFFVIKRTSWYSLSSQDLVPITNFGG